MPKITVTIDTKQWDSFQEYINQTPRDIHAVRNLFVDDTHICDASGHECKPVVKDYLTTGINEATGHDTDE